MFFLCGCFYLSFSDILDYVYAVMMLNILRSDITIKIQHGIRATLKEDTVQLHKLGILTFWVSLHNPSAKGGWVEHPLKGALYVDVESDSGHFSVFDLPLHREIRDFH